MRSSPHGILRRRRLVRVLGAPSRSPARSRPHHVLRGRAPRQLGLQTTAMHDQNAIGHAQHLRQVRRDQHDADARCTSSSTRRWTSRLGPHVDALGGLVEDQHGGLRGEPLAQHDLLLVAAREVAGRQLGRRRPDLHRLDVAPARSATPASSTKPSRCNLGSIASARFSRIDSGRMRPWRPRSSGSNASPCGPCARIVGNGSPRKRTLPCRRDRLRRPPGRSRNVPEPTRPARPTISPSRTSKLTS